MAKTYGQFCGMARALDHVGDRWTLLVIRELLLADATYGGLVAGLGGVPTNLLADRLRQLEADGLISREVGEEDRRQVRYQLTPLGRGLEPVVFGLIRWGAAWMASGPGGDRFDPRWMALAVRALVDGRRSVRAGTVELRVSDDPLTIGSTGKGKPVAIERAGAAAHADAVIEGDAALVLAVLSGEMHLRAALGRGLTVRGDRAVARALLEPASL